MIARARGLRLNVRQLASVLRSLNASFDGPASVGLTSEFAYGLPHVAMTDERGVKVVGLEELPGDDRPFDAVACARRLLAAWRDAYEG